MLNKKFNCQKTGKTLEEIVQCCFNDENFINKNNIDANNNNNNEVNEVYF